MAYRAILVFLLLDVLHAVSKGSVIARRPSHLISRRSNRETHRISFSSWDHISSVQDSSERFIYKRGGACKYGRWEALSLPQAPNNEGAFTRCSFRHPVSCRMETHLRLRSKKDAMSTLRMRRGGGHNSVGGLGPDEDENLHSQPYLLNETATAAAKKRRRMRRALTIAAFASFIMGIGSEYVRKGAEPAPPSAPVVSSYVPNIFAAFDVAPSSEIKESVTATAGVGAAQKAADRGNYDGAQKGGNEDNGGGGHHGGHDGNGGGTGWRGDDPPRVAGKVTPDPRYGLLVPGGDMQLHGKWGVVILFLLGIITAISILVVGEILLLLLIFECRKKVESPKMSPFYGITVAGKPLKKTDSKSKDSIAEHSDLFLVEANGSTPLNGPAGKANEHVGSKDHNADFNVRIDACKGSALPMQRSEPGAHWRSVENAGYGDNSSAQMKSKNTKGDVDSPSAKANLTVIFVGAAKTENTKNDIDKSADATDLSHAGNSEPGHGVGTRPDCERLQSIYKMSHDMSHDNVKDSVKSQHEISGNELKPLLFDHNIGQKGQLIAGKLSDGPCPQEIIPSVATQSNEQTSAKSNEAVSTFLKESGSNTQSASGALSSKISSSAFKKPEGKRIENNSKFELAQGRIAAFITSTQSVSLLQNRFPNSNGTGPADLIKEGKKRKENEKTSTIEISRSTSIETSASNQSALSCNDTEGGYRTPKSLQRSEAQENGRPDGAVDLESLSNYSMDDATSSGAHDGNGAQIESDRFISDTGDCKIQGENPLAGTYVNHPKVLSSHDKQHSKDERLEGDIPVTLDQASSSASVETKPKLRRRASRILQYPPIREDIYGADENAHKLSDVGKAISDMKIRQGIFPLQIDEEGSLQQHVSKLPSSYLLSVQGGKGITEIVKTPTHGEGKGENASDIQMNQYLHIPSLYHMFSNHDADHDGYLSIRDFLVLYETMAKTGRKVKVEICKENGWKSDQRITFRDFKQVVRNKFPKLSLGPLIADFAALPQDSRGAMPVEDVVQLILRSREFVEYHFEEVDKDDDGFIDFRKFCNLMRLFYEKYHIHLSKTKVSDFMRHKHLQRQLSQIKSQYPKARRQSGVYIPVLERLVSAPARSSLSGKLTPD